MSNHFLSKLIFVWKRPKVIVVTGDSRACAKEAIFQVLKPHLKVGKEILLYEVNSRDSQEFEFLLKRSRLPILVVTHVGEYHPDKEFFAGELEEVKEIIKLAEVLPAHGYLILNFDDETVRDLKNKSKAHPLTFGFGARANFRATDIVLTQFPGLGTNFKINYEGSMVPVWLEKLFGKEQIYAALLAAAVGEVFGLNLVEISGALKFYQGLSGKMKLIEGVKNSWILDGSENASPLSTLEALEILKNIAITGRRIAVLGDILGIGKYTIEAHEAIGEAVKNSADLLFTVGPRARFFAEGAKQKGMLEDKIFQFDTASQAGKAVEVEIREGDLILVDGSKEMEMPEVVEEIKLE